MWLQPAASSRSSSPRRQLSPRHLRIAGAVMPTKYSTLKGRGFSTFSYSHDGQPDPYEHAERERRSRLSGVGGSRPGSATSSARGGAGASPRPVFATRALPAAPKQAGAFQRFQYTIDPFELKDASQRDMRGTGTRRIAGAFVAGGNARDEKRILQRRLPELRAQLRNALRADWPSFACVFPRPPLLACHCLTRASLPLPSLT